MMPNGRRSVRLEHQLTRPSASLVDLEAAVRLAVEHDLTAIRVAPWLVKPARRALGGSRVALGTVVGYPHGGQLASVKAFEASRALEQGATEVDFVLNAGALVSGADQAVYEDIVGVVDMVHAARGLAGVIVEPEPLPEALMRRACRLAERAGVDYVVAGTGRASGSTAVQRTALLREACGPRVLVKAAGQFDNADEILAAAAAGATRVSAELDRVLIDEALGVATAARSAR